MAENREEIIRNFRQFATFLEENPDVPTPNMFGVNGSVLCWHSLTKENLANIASTAAKFGMKVTKNYTEFGFHLRLGEAVDFTAFVPRDVVCRKVPVGEPEMVERPDYSNIPKIKVQEQKYEWVCDEPLLKASDD